MDLIWASDGELFVAGPDTRAHVHQGRAGTSLTGIRLPPGLGPLVLGVPAHLLRDRRVDLALVMRPAEARDIVDAAGSIDATAVLEAFAARGLRDARSSEADRLAMVVRLLDDGWAVSAVAKAVNLSERQLRRRSVDAFGYGPKTLARIRRLGRAVDAARRGGRPADVAARTGYADQAHLAREFSALAGVSVRTLLAEDAMALDDAPSDSFKTSWRAVRTVDGR